LTKQLDEKKNGGSMYVYRLTHVMHGTHRYIIERVCSAF